jgi:hypothetical protein
MRLRHGHEQQQGTCDHTVIATQTGGSGIFAVARKK